jgi:hypothetical protein
MGNSGRYPLSFCLFGFHVLRVKLAYDDKDPSRDKSTPGSGGKWERNFYDNGFRPEHAKQIYTEIRFHLKMEFMTVVEISFSFFPLFPFCFMIWLSAETVYAHFSTVYRRQFAITWNNDCIH